MNRVLEEPVVNAVEILNLARGGDGGRIAAPVGVGGDAVAGCGLAVNGRLKGGYIPSDQRLDGI